MTAGDVITAARRVLNDTQKGNYRWPDADLRRYLNEARQYLFRHRPDLYLHTDGTMNSVTEATTALSVLILDVDMKEPLADYIVALALGEDSSATANAQRSQLHYSKFIVGAGLAR